LYLVSRSLSLSLILLAAAAAAAASLQVSSLQPQESLFILTRRGQVVQLFFNSHHDARLAGKTIVHPVRDPRGRTEGRGLIAGHQVSSLCVHRGIQSLEESILRKPVRLCTLERASSTRSDDHPWTRLRDAYLFNRGSLDEICLVFLGHLFGGQSSTVMWSISLRLTSFLGLFLLLCSSSVVVAREIVFPPLAPLQANNGHAQYRSSFNNEKQSLVDLDKFAGLTTFSNLPWVHCLSEEADVEKYDIAFLGAPFDTATTGRPGTRYGPSGIRL